MKATIKADHDPEAWYLMPVLAVCHKAPLWGVVVGWLRWQWTFAWRPAYTMPCAECGVPCKPVPSNVDGPYCIECAGPPMPKWDGKIRVNPCVWLGCPGSAEVDCPHMTPFTNGGGAP